MQQTILVCDDEKEIVEAISIYLEGEGFRVLKAYDGFEALKLMENEKVDLIIMDVMMPGLDGIHTTLKIRETSSVPIIILSAKSEDTDKILGLNIGADDYISKPFNPLELVARVKSQLRRYTQLGVFAAALLGGLLAFLLFNAHPAKVFMGDTGSLFLGGAVAGMAFAFDMPLVLVLVGIVYIVETLSDILQVAYFKLTHGKRIFKMAPIHHHFEMCGWSEVKIVTVFTAVSVLFCALALFGVMERMMV